MIAAILVALPIAAAAGDVKITSGGTAVEVDGDRFYLLEGDHLVKASASTSGKGDRLVVDLIRIGDPVGSHEGEAPVVVTIAGQKNVLPNKPALHADRKVSGVAGMVASYPVRYFLDLPKKPSVSIEVELRKKRPGERAAVKMQVLGGGAGAPLPSASLEGPKRPSSGKKKPAVAPADAGVLIAEAPVDAGAAVVEPAAPVPTAPAPVEKKTGRLVVMAKDDMGELFKLRERRVIVDGTLVLNESAYGNDTLSRQQAAFDQAVPVGKHDVTINLVYSGQGGGLFSYMEGYVFHVNDGRPVQAVADQVTRVTFIAKELGGIFTEIEDRPTIVTDVQTSAQ